MIRRTFLATIALATLVSAIGLPPVQAAEVPKGKRPLNITQFESAIKTLGVTRVATLDKVITYATIPQLQDQFKQGSLTSEELVTYYLWRIQRYDLNKLNSVTELNPDALEIAKTLDAERAAGKLRGPLHGTVALLKDNIGTGDKLHNTAGAKVLQEARSDRDAFLVRKLRDAGVIILGKAAMTEWAAWMGAKQPNGYSSVGGQVYSPYDKKMDPWGSSTGPAVAVVSNFATFAIGTETWGSLSTPALFNSAAALKPSMGLISRDRIIPILDSQDVAGPLTRNVTDIALIMDAIVGTDPADPITVAAATAPKGFAHNLDGNGLRGMRVGVFPGLTPEESDINTEMITALHTAGAEVIELTPVPTDTVTEFDSEFTQLGYYGFKVGLERYLAATHAPVQTLPEIIAFNLQDKMNRMKYGQEYVVSSSESTMSPEEYAKRSLAIGQKARKNIDSLMAQYNLDMMGGTGLAVLLNAFYQGAGYPAIVIQAGYHNSNPIGFVLTGRLFDDSKLIHAAYTLEQQTQAWQAPRISK